MIAEALGGGRAEVRWVLLGDAYAAGERGRGIVAACRKRGVATVFASDGDVRELCHTKVPRPVLACVRPRPPESRLPERGRYLMTLGVQVPGNLGTLIRSAWAFGLDGVVAGAGTVDPWNAKVVRASAGALFHIPLIEESAGLGCGGGDGEREAKRLNLLCADAAGAPLEAVAQAHASDWVLVVGNEGSGIPLARRSGGRAVAVPMAPGVDSLNVAMAGSILMYALTRPAAGDRDDAADARGASPGRPGDAR